MDAWAARVIGIRARPWAPTYGDKGAPGATGTSYSNLQARDLTEPPARHTTGAQ
jgi:hypothetical protein